MSGLYTSYFKDFKDTDIVIFSLWPYDVCQILHRDQDTEYSDESPDISFRMMSSKTFMNKAMNGVKEIKP